MAGTSEREEDEVSRKVEEDEAVEEDEEFLEEQEEIIRKKKAEREAEGEAEGEKEKEREAEREEEEKEKEEALRKEEANVAEAKKVVKGVAADLLKLWLINAWKPSKPAKRASPRKKASKRSRRVVNSPVSSSSSSELGDKSLSMFEKHGITVHESQSTGSVIVKGNGFSFTLDSPEFALKLFRNGDLNTFVQVLSSAPCTPRRQITLSRVPKTKVSLATLINNGRTSFLHTLVGHLSKSGETIVRDMDAVRVLEARMEKLRLKRASLVSGILAEYKVFDGLHASITSGVSDLSLNEEGIILPSLVSFYLYKTFRRSSDTPSSFFCLESNPEKDIIQEAVESDGKALYYY